MKREIIICLMIISGASTLCAQPPNNAIFKGGNGDGWNLKNSISVSNNIFSGGAGDGFNLANANVIGNSIFNGGSGDGWKFSSYNPTPNSIYLGGQGDGWNTTNLVSLPNAIYSGGIGDGWSKVIYPLGPLPVTLLSFAGEQQGKINLLKWATTAEVNTSHFDLERSVNSYNYTFIKRVLAVGISNSAKNYSSVDEQPLAGNNFYRLKMVDADGKYEYSNVVLLRVLDDVLLSVFPNPAADKLNISITSIQTIKQIQLYVFDNGGKMIAQQSVANNNTISLDVSRYSTGVYVLKLLYNGKEESIRFVKSK